MSDEQGPRESTEVKRIRDSDTNPYMGLHSPETTPCVEDVYCSIADEDVVLPSKRCKSVLYLPIKWMETISSTCTSFQAHQV